MANAKVIMHLYNATGKTLYCIIRRDVDGYLKWNLEVQHE